MVNQNVLFDQRWIGQHGIGRFASELQSRLSGVQTQALGGSPTSPLDALRLGVKLWRSNLSYFSPGFNAPLPLPLASKRNYVFSIHDLIHVHHSAEASLAKRLYYATVVRAAARRAFAVLTVSEYSKDEIVRWAGIAPDRVRVVYNGVGQAFTQQGDRLDRRKPYLLYVGNQKPHKNVPSLIAALALVRKHHDVDLILSGQAAESTTRAIDEFGVAEHVSFLGSVGDEKLATAYRGALATVMPSEYEGFGLPLVESMACGTPVVSSNATALPEIAGDAAELVDPNCEAIAAGVIHVLGDEARRQQLIENGLQRSTAFSWQRTASLVQAVLDDLRLGLSHSSEGTGS